MNGLKITYVILALGIVTHTSCSKSATVASTEQQIPFCATPSYAADWGKHRHYIAPEDITTDEPYNLYDNTLGTPLQLKQISTAEGPRYQQAKIVADYFNSTEWPSVFAPLGNPAHTADLAKLQSGNYFFIVKDYNGIRYFEARTVVGDVMEFVLQVTLR